MDLERLRKKNDGGPDVVAIPVTNTVNKWPGCPRVRPGDLMVGPRLPDCTACIAFDAIRETNHTLYP